MGQTSPQACLVYWSVVSPFKPFGPTLALVFVLLVAALKAIAEDRRRHIEDSKLNNSTAHVLNPDGGC
jgi:phospholipid-transporting ATPase